MGYVGLRADLQAEVRQETAGMVKRQLGIMDRAMAAEARPANASSKALARQRPHVRCVLGTKSDVESHNSGGASGSTSAPVHQADSKAGDGVVGDLDVSSLVIDDYFGKVVGAPTRLGSRGPLDPLLYMRVQNQQRLGNDFIGSCRRPLTQHNSSEEMSDQMQPSEDDVAASSEMFEWLRKAKARFRQTNVASTCIDEKLSRGRHGPALPRESETDTFFDVPETMDLHERWSAVLQGASVKDFPEESLRWLVGTGTPMKYRHELWPRWWAPSELQVVDIDELQAQVADEHGQVIEADLRRTRYEFLSDDQRTTLRRVLRAYAAYNPAVGYCQGMNFLVSVPLLLAFGEQQAFDALRYLVTVVCPGYHDRSLEGFRRDVTVLAAMIKMMLPDVHAEFEELDMRLDLLATEHLLTMSARTWPLNAVVRLYDIILLEGSPALLGSFLALLKIYFLDAAAAAKREVDLKVNAADVILRFRDLTKDSVSRDIDEVVQETHKFARLVRGEHKLNSAPGSGELLELLRAKVDCA